MDKKTMKHLSYSGYNTYMTCPKKYDYHYNEKLKPEAIPFHLLYGSAVDAAITVLLHTDTKENALKAAAKKLYRVFREKVIFTQSDIDLELQSILTEDILYSKLIHFGYENSTVEALVTNAFNLINNGLTLSKSQDRMIKHILIYNTLEKIFLMLKGFEDYIEPQIEDVISIQKNVKRGILDFEAKIKGINETVLVDVKTSSRDYPNDAVLKSVQLAGYGAKTGAYLVFNKNIRKNKTKVCGECGNNGTGKRHKTCDQLVDGVRCNAEWIEEITPEVIPQFIISELPENNVKMIEEEYQKTESLIEQKVFPRNLNNCGQQYGQPCSYINLCWGGDYSGLVKEIKK
jgi:hypothetical protein